MKSPPFRPSRLAGDIEYLYHGPNHSRSVRAPYMA